MAQNIPQPIYRAYEPSNIAARFKWGNVGATSLGFPRETAAQQLLAPFTPFYIIGLPKPRAEEYSGLLMATYKTKTQYKCHECGATSYQQVIDRGPSGALQATGQYRCSGCRSIFASIRAWWEPRRTPEFQPSAFQPSAFQPSSFAG